MIYMAIRAFRRYFMQLSGTHKTDCLIQGNLTIHPNLFLLLSGIKSLEPNRPESFPHITAIVFME